MCKILKLDNTLFNTLLSDRMHCEHTRIAFKAVSIKSSKVDHLPRAMGTIGDKAANVLGPEVSMPSPPDSMLQRMA